MRPLKALLSIIMLAVAPIVFAPLKAEAVYVEGHDGVPLAVTVEGPEDGPPILFLHGIGMGAESFSPQLRSELAEKYRMVAFDLRGHGLSGKPSEAAAYTSRDAWAADVAAVIAATGLDRPIIVAWSYGTLVTADYLLANGGESISGLVMVAAHGGIAPRVPSDSAPDPKVMEEMSLYYRLRQSPALADQQSSVELLAPYLYENTAQGPSEEWKAQAKVLGLLVPPYAQSHLRAHPNDNEAVGGLLSDTPVMLVHGSKDFALTPGDISAAQRAIPHLVVETFEGGGHSPFAEQPAQFNALLASFVDEIWRKSDD